MVIVTTHAIASILFTQRDPGRLTASGSGTGSSSSSTPRLSDNTTTVNSFVKLAVIFLEIIHVLKIIIVVGSKTVSIRILRCVFLLITKSDKLNFPAQVLQRLELLNNNSLYMFVCRPEHFVVLLLIGLAIAESTHTTPDTIVG